MPTPFDAEACQKLAGELLSRLQAIRLEEEGAIRGDQAEAIHLFLTEKGGGVNKWLQSRVQSKNRPTQALHVEGARLAAADLHAKLVKHTCCSDESFFRFLFGERNGFLMDTAATRRSNGERQARLTFRLADVREWLINSGGPIVVPANFLKLLGVDEHPERELRMTTMNQKEHLGRAVLSCIDGVDGVDVADGQVATLGFSNEQSCSKGSRNVGSIRLSWSSQNGNRFYAQFPTLLVLVCLYLHHTVPEGGDEALERIRDGGHPHAFLTRSSMAGEDGQTIIVVETDETREEMWEEMVSEVEAMIEEGGGEGEVPLLGGGGVGGSVAMLVDTELRVVDGEVVVYSTSSGTPRRFSDHSGRIQIPLKDIENGTRKQKFVAAGRVVESFLAARLPEKYGYLDDVHALAAKHSVALHYDHWIDLNSHTCTRGCSPLQNLSFMGARGEMPPLDQEKCTQFAGWTFKGETGTDENGADIVKVDLLSDGTGDAPGVVWMDDDLRKRVFVDGRTLKDAYPIKQYPLIWLPDMRVLLCRHGQIYGPVDRTVDASTMTDGWFRLRALHMTRTGYPVVVTRTEMGTRSWKTWKCHVLMAWACLGDRPSNRVTDHKSQNNRLDFSEGNLEYVTRSVNAQRHHDFVRASRAAAVEAAAVVEEDNAGADNGDAAASAAKRQGSITSFFKPLKKQKVAE